jgi:hypothetical protein
MIHAMHHALQARPTSKERNGVIRMVIALESEEKKKTHASSRTQTPIFY